MTLLAPLKHITAIKLSKFLLLAGSTAKTTQPKSSNLESEAAPTLPQDSDSFLTPRDILEEQGSQLREAREKQQLSIEDISARTQIQPRMVQAIEEGHLEMLPDRVYVQGMVKRYANCLGLNGAQVAEQLPVWKRAEVSFDPTTHLQVTGINRPNAKKVQAPKIAYGSSPLSPWQVYIVYTLLVLGLVGGTSYFLAPMTKHHAIGDPKTQPLATQPAKKVATAPTATLPDIKIQIEVVAPTWAQIGLDGRTRVVGNLQPGTKFEWTAQKQITVNTNNAGGLVVGHGNRPPQPLGKQGEKQSRTIKLGK